MRFLSTTHRLRLPRRFSKNYTDQLEQWANRIPRLTLTAGDGVVLTEDANDFSYVIEVPGGGGGSGIPGPPGPAGPTGPKGEPGLNGIDGLDGVDGTDGVDGADGADGADGFVIEPTTYTALSAALAAGTLTPGHMYSFNYELGGSTLDGVIIYIFATDVDRLAHGVHVDVGTMGFSTFDETPWWGRYNIGLNLFEELHDDLGNSVTGCTLSRSQCDAFPWGNGSARNNIHASNITWSDPTLAITDNDIRTSEFFLGDAVSVFNFNRVYNCTDMTLAGGTDIVVQRCDWFEASIDLPNGTMQDCIVHNATIANSNTSSDVDYGNCRIDGNSTITIEATGSNDINFDYCNFEQGSSFTVSGLGATKSFTYVTLQHSIVNFSGASGDIGMTDVLVKGTSTLDFSGLTISGDLSLFRVTVLDASQITIDDISFTQLGISDWFMSNNSLFSITADFVDFNLQSTIMNSGDLTISSSGATYTMTECSIRSGASFTVSIGSATLTCNGLDIYANAPVTHTAGAISNLVCSLGGSLSVGHAVTNCFHHTNTADTTSTTRSGYGEDLNTAKTW